MVKLALSALLWLHPVQHSGLIEATNEPRLGIRRTIEIKGTDFGFALGTGYQALRAGITTPPWNEYPGGRTEVEHLWQGGKEIISYRFHIPMSARHPIYLTEEFRLTRVVLWRTEDPNHRGSGRRSVTQAREQHIYITWAGERLLARLGTTQGFDQVGISLSAQW